MPWYAVPMSRAKPTQQRRELAFERAVLARLKLLSARLTAVLKKLIAHDYPADFWQLDFEVHGQGAFEEGFPVQVYYYRKGYDQIMEGTKVGTHTPPKSPTPC